MYPLIGHIWGVPIYTYGLMCAIGLAVGYFVVQARAKREGVSEDDILNLFILLIIVSIAGARLTYVLSYPERLRDWTDIFRLWRGGLTIMGGGIAIFFTFIAYGKYYKLSPGLLLDLFFGAIPIGIVFGRLGCFGYGCCYGKACSLPWAVTFPNVTPMVPRHPTQLYSSACMIIIFLILRWLREKPHPDGRETVHYTYCYGTYRFFMEMLRDDVSSEHYLFSLTLAQSMVIGTVLIAFLIDHFYLSKQPKLRPSKADETNSANEGKWWNIKV